MANIDKYKNKEKRKEYIKNWQNGHKDATCGYLNKWYAKRKKEALLIVGRGRLECSRCSSTDYNLLEINHINGGGHKERKIHGGSGLMRLIISGKRNIKDLNLLCRPCNLVSAAERISGKKYILAP